MTSTSSRSPPDWTAPFIAGGEGGGGGSALSRFASLPAVALFSRYCGGGGGGGGMFGRCDDDVLAYPGFGDGETPGAARRPEVLGFLRMSGGGSGRSPDCGAAFRLSGGDGGLAVVGVGGCTGFGLIGGGAFSLSTLFISSTNRTFFGALTVIAA